MLADNVVPADRRARARTRRARRSARCSCAHVIGGKHLSQRADFTAMVRGATPDVVLTGVELLARGLDAEHPGPATWSSSTSAARPPTCTRWSSSTPRTPTLAREVVATTPVTRTVEGDLGMRWSAVPTVARRRPRPARRSRRQRPRGPHADPAFSPTDAEAADADEAIAAAAVGLALRRHAGRPAVRRRAPTGRVVERSGKDLREVDLLVGSGGVLRNGRPGVAAAGAGRQHRRRRRGRLAAPAGDPRSSSTPTTSWPPPGLLAARTRRRRTGCWRACVDAVEPAT